MTKISQYRPGLKKAHILDAYLAQIKCYESVYMPIHYLAKYFNSENKSFISVGRDVTKTAPARFSC